MSKLSIFLLIILIIDIILLVKTIIDYGNSGEDLIE